MKVAAENAEVSVLREIPTNYMDEMHYISASDIVLLSEMVRRAEIDAAELGSTPTLLHVLRQYEVVLREHGMGSTSDTHFYKIILRLNRLPGNDWWAKLSRQSEKGWSSSSPLKIRKDTCNITSPTCKSTAIFTPTSSHSLNDVMTTLPINKWLGFSHATTPHHQHHLELVPEKENTSFHNIADFDTNTCVTLASRERHINEQHTFTTHNNNNNNNSIEHDVERKHIVQCFHNWRSFVAELKSKRSSRQCAIEQCTKALTLWQNTLCKRLFVAWRCKVHESATTLIIVRNAIVQSTQRRYLRRWRRRRIVRARRYVALGTAVQLWSHTLMRHCLCGWYKHSAWLTSFQRQRLYARCANVFTEWNTLTNTITSHTTKLLCIAELRLRRTQRVVFRSWRRSAHLKSSVDTCTQLHPRYQLSSSWQTWLVVTRQRSLAILYRCRALLRSCFSLWRYNHQFLYRSSILLVRATQFHRHCVFIKLLPAWLHYAQIHQATSIIDTMCIRMKARNLITYWHTMTLQCVALQHSFVSVSHHHQCMMMCVCMRVWRQLVLRHHQLQSKQSLIVYSYSQRILSHIFHSWRRISLQHFTVRMNMMTAVEFSVKRRLRHAVSRFIHLVAASHRSSSLHLSASVFWTNRCSIQTLHTWRWYVQHCVYKRTSTRIAHTHRDKCVCQTSFKQWCVTYHLHTSHTTHRYNIVHHRRIMMMMRHWHRVTCVRIKARQAIHHCMSMYHHHQRHQIFIAWRNFITYKCLLHTHTHTIMMTRQWRFLRHWVLHTRFTRALRIIHHTLHHHTLTAALTIWFHHYATDMYRLRRAMLYAQQALQRNHRECFNAWLIITHHHVELHTRYTLWISSARTIHRIRSHAFACWRRRRLRLQRVKALFKQCHTLTQRALLRSALIVWLVSSPLLVHQTARYQGLRQRAQHHRVALAFNVWRKRLHVERCARQLTRKHFMQRWRSTKKLVLSLRHVSRRILCRDTIIVWHRFARHRSHTHTSIRHAITFCTHQTTQHALNHLRQHALLSHHHHTQYIIATHTYLTHLLQHWKHAFQHSSHIGACYEYLLRRRQRACLLASLSAWRSIARTNIDVRNAHVNATRCVRVQRLRCGVRCLRENARRHQRSRRLVAVLSRVRKYSLQRKVFLNGFVTFIITHRALHTAHVSVHQRHQHHCRAALWTRWRNVTTSCHVQREAMQLAHTHHLHTQQRNVIFAWQRVCPAIKHIKHCTQSRFIFTLQRRRRRQTLRTWHRSHTRKRHLLHLVTNVFISFFCMPQRQAWNSWKCYLHLTHTLHIVRQRTHTTTQRRIVTAWALQRRVTMRYTRWRHRHEQTLYVTVFNALCVWQRASITRCSRLRVLCKHLLAIHHRNLRDVALINWVTWHRRRRVMQAHVHAMLRAQHARVLCAWCVLAAAQHHWRRVKLRSSFTQLVCVGAQRHKRMRCVAERHARQRALLLGVWRHATRTRHRYNECIVGMQRERATRRCKCVWQRWRIETCLRQRHRDVTQRCRWRLQRYTLLRWRHSHHLAQSSRHDITAFTRVVALHSSSSSSSSSPHTSSSSSLHTSSSSSSSSRAVFAKACLQRWQCLHTSRTFHHWLTYTVCCRRRRQHTSHVNTMMRRYRCRVYVCQWHVFVKLRCHTRSVMSIARIRRVSVCYRTWVKMYSHQCLQNVLYAKAVLFHNAVTQRCVCAVWHRSLCRRRHVRALGVTLHTQQQHRIAMKCVQAWHHRGDVLRAQLHHWHVKHVLRPTLHHWRSLHTQRHTHTLHLQRSISSARTHTQHVAFTRWRNVCNHARRKRHSMMQFRRYFTLRAVTLTLRHWLQLARIRRNVGDKLFYFFLRWPARRVFSAWRSACTQQCRQRVLRRRERTLHTQHTHNTLIAHLHAWSGLRCRIAWWQCVCNKLLLPRMFNAWRCFTHIMNTARTHLPHQACQRHFRALHSLCTRRRALRQRACIVRAVSSNVCVRIALTAWRVITQHHVNVLHIARTFIERHHHHHHHHHDDGQHIVNRFIIIMHDDDGRILSHTSLLLHRVLHAWHTQQHVVHHARITHHHHQLHTALMIWRNNVLQRQRLRKHYECIAVKHYTTSRQRMMCDTFNTIRQWCRVEQIGNTIQQQQQQQQQRHHHHHHHHHPCMRALRIWRVACDVRIRTRRFVLACERQRVVVVRRRVLCVWRNTFLRHRFTHTILRYHRVCHQRHTLHRWRMLVITSRTIQISRVVVMHSQRVVLSHWRALVNARHQHSHALHELQRNTHTRLLRQHTHAWCVLTHTHQHHHHQHTLKMHRVITSCFIVWRSHTQSSLHAANAIQRIHRMHKHYTLTQHIHAWKLLLFCILNSRSSRRRCVWSVWCRATHHQRHQRLHITRLLRAWHKRVCSRKHTVTSLHRHRREQSQRLHIREWLILTHNVCELNRLVELQLQRRVERRLRMCLARLRSVCIRSRQCLVATLHVRNARRRRCLHSMFQSILMLYRLSCVRQRFIAACRKPTLKNTLCLLRHITHTNIVCAHNYERITHQRDHRIQLHMLTKWRTLTSSLLCDRFKHNRAVLHATMSAQSCVFRSWFAHISHRQSRKTHCWAIVASINTNRAARRFHAWSLVAYCCRRQRCNLIASTLRTWCTAVLYCRASKFHATRQRHAALKRHWFLWIQQLHNVQYLDQCVYDFKRHRYSVLMLNTIRYWVKLRRQRCANRVVLARAISWHSQQLYHKAFAALRRGVSISRDTSNTQWQLARATHYTHSIQSAFLHLRCFALRTKAINEALTQRVHAFKASWRARHQHMYVWVWRRATHLLSSARSVLIQHMTILLYRHLLAWHHTTCHRHRLRRHLQAADAYHRYQCLSVLLSRWRSLVRMLQWKRSVANVNTQHLLMKPNTREDILTPLLNMKIHKHIVNDNNNDNNDK